jgi:hypothetical protein
MIITLAISPNFIDVLLADARTSTGQEHLTGTGSQKGNDYEHNHRSRLTDFVHCIIHRFALDAITN